MTAPLTGTVGYRYDRLSHRTHLIYPDGRVVSYLYSDLGQMASLTDWAAQTTSFDYDAAGQPLTTTRPNGIATGYLYDTAHRLTGLSHVGISGPAGVYTYTRDALGHVSQAQEWAALQGAPELQASLSASRGSVASGAVSPSGARGSVTGLVGGSAALAFTRAQITAADTLSTSQQSLTYAYDALYRVLDVTYAGGDHFHYAYDAVGNVLTRTQTVLGVATVTTYTYNAANQLVTAKTDGEPIVWHYTYDANGSLLEVTPDGSPAAGATRYTYNASLQLVAVEQHDGSAYAVVSQMLYDGLGQRRQVTAWAGGVSATTTYAVDSQQGSAVLAATSAGQTTFYLHGPNGPLAELTVSWGYYLADGQGTARQLSDASGAITLQRRYTPWGEVLDQQGRGTFA